MDITEFRNAAGDVIGYLQWEIPDGRIFTPTCATCRTKFQTAEPALARCGVCTMKAERKDPFGCNETSRAAAAV